MPACAAPRFPRVFTLSGHFAASPWEIHSWTHVVKGSVMDTRHRMGSLSLLNLSPNPLLIPGLCCPSRALTDSSSRDNDETKKRNLSFWKCFQEPPLPFCPLSTAGFSLLAVISFEPLYQFPQHLQGFNLLMPLFAFIPEAFPLSALSFSFLDLSRLRAMFGVNARRALGCPGEWSLAVV